MSPGIASTILEEAIGPITQFDPVKIVGWYLVFYLLAVVGSNIATKIYEEVQRITVYREVDFDMLDVVLAGPYEELAFRGTAVGIASLFGWPIIVVVALANGVWASFHQRRFGTFAFTFIFGIYLSRFWYGGAFVQPGPFGEITWLFVVTPFLVGMGLSLTMSSPPPVLYWGITGVGVIAMVWWAWVTGGIWIVAVVAHSFHNFVVTFVDREVDPRESGAPAG